MAPSSPIVIYDSDGDSSGAQQEVEVIVLDDTDTDEEVTAVTAAREAPAVAPPEPRRVSSAGESNCSDPALSRILARMRAGAFTHGEAPTLCCLAVGRCCSICF